MEITTVSKKSNFEKFLGIKQVKQIVGNYLPTDVQKNGIEIYFQKYGYRKSQDRYTRLAHFLVNGIEDFISEEIKLLQHQRMSEKYFCILYGENNGKVKWKKHCAKTRKGRPNCKEYWINKGFTEEESIEKVKAHQKLMSERSSKNRDHKKFSIRCIEYWINKGYSQNQAEEIISDAQKRDLAFYIEKYGINDGYRKYKNSCDKRIKTWGNKSFEERKSHYLKTLQSEYNVNGQEIKAIELFLSQNNIEKSKCMFGAPKEQFYQWIENVGFRRYDLAIFSDYERKNLIAIMEFHGPGHINFSDYNPTMKDDIIKINGITMPHLGTYGANYQNDITKRKHILEKYPNCKYYVFWWKNLKEKDFKVYDLQ